MSRSLRPRLRLAALAAAVAALSAYLAWGGPSGAGAATAGELTVRPSFGAPTNSFLGTAPREAAGAVWAVNNRNLALVRYTDAGGWEAMPAPTPAPGSTEAPQLAFGAAAGRTTPRGGIALAGQSEERQILLVRDPGGGLRGVPDPPESLLAPGKDLYGFGAERLLAVREEDGGGTGAYIVPEDFESVLHYGGEEWSSEPICLAAEPSCEPVTAAAFQVVSIASGEGEAWLLARGADPADGVELFHRELTGEGPAWVRYSLGGALGALYGSGESLGVQPSPRFSGQPLTVTSKGVWVDALLTGATETRQATFYLEIASGAVTGSWCDLESAAPFCSFPLASQLPAGEGRSFAWPPSGSGFGTRTVTGVGDGAILTLDGTTFYRVALAGGGAGGEYGAALSGPEEGWLGASPPLQLVHEAGASTLASWPVPFRRPLTAIAPEPGAAVGDLESEALAVGANGQVARYVPGQGWEPEFLLSGSGRRATPTLRGVAWPEAGLAYAVGDEASMWRWQQATGLWQPDPGQAPNLTRASFTGIAFDPEDSTRGYAIGKQGVLLRFARRWTQEKLPEEIPAEANFTSIAFAGEEAIVTWKMPTRNGSVVGDYEGGVIVDDGSGWRVDESAGAALGGATPQRVAGLPDGGAVISSMGELETGNREAATIVRQGPGAAWEKAAGRHVGYPVALAAVREGGQVRAIASVVSKNEQAIDQGAKDRASDEEQITGQPSEGQAPLLTSPYPLPAGGVVIHQTASGWRDEQGETYPLPPKVSGQTEYDLPQRPDPVLALLVAPDGSGGWAVGGETGTSITLNGGRLQTAGVLRYGPVAEPPSNAASVPIETETGRVSFAIGGNAQCAAACGDMSGAGIGPDRWLRGAIGRAAGIAGLRAFLYTGPGVAFAPEGGPLSGSVDASTFGIEEAEYARRLGGAGGGLPIFAAASETDLGSDSSLSTFAAAFAGYGAPLGSGGAGAGVAPVSQASAAQGYYSFDSTGEGGRVRVVVLDYSRLELGAAQRCWLVDQLASARAAKTPAIVVGQRDLAGQLDSAAVDRGTVTAILVGGAGGCAPAEPTGSASAYFFDFPEQNRAYRLSSGGRAIPAYGSGTLGYVTPPLPTDTDFAGASGFMIASVDVAGRDAETNVAPVSVELVPAIGGLALDATDGTLLRRSQSALFQALARRPIAGIACTGNAAPRPCETASPEPYVEIPSECVGATCATTLFPAYTFTSSEPDIADFVASDPAAVNPRSVLLVEDKPVLDSHSGLLCAFNAGTTLVTVTTGGLSYTQKVTVQAGSVQRPCGTTPLRNRNTASGNPEAPPAPVPGESPEASPPIELVPPPPPVPAQPAQPAAPQAKPAPTQIPPVVYFPPPTSTTVAPVPFVPPPPPPAIQPVPPSGTSSVSVTEEEEEDEEAFDMVSSMAALESPGPAREPLWSSSSAADSGSGFRLAGLLPIAILLAAIAAAAGSGRRGRRRPAYQLNHDNRRYR